MGRSQGGHRLFNESLDTDALGLAAGSPFRLDQVRTGSHQLLRQPLLLPQGQTVGNSHGQGHFSQQRPAAPGQLQHLGPGEVPPLLVEAVEVPDFHQVGPGSHHRGKPFRLHGRNADRGYATGSRQTHQLGVGGNVHQVGSTRHGSFAHMAHPLGRKGLQAGNDFQALAGSKTGRKADGKGHGRKGAGTGTLPC